MRCVVYRERGLPSFEHPDGERRWNSNVASIIETQTSFCQRKCSAMATKSGGKMADPIGVTIGPPSFTSMERERGTNEVNFIAIEALR